MTLKKIAEFYASVCESNVRNATDWDSSYWDQCAKQCAQAIRTAILPPELVAKIERDRRDAERYRWLRNQRWDTAVLCVVTAPKESVRLGGYCPSKELLDDAIDAIAGEYDA